MPMAALFLQATQLIATMVTMHGKDKTYQHYALSSILIDAATLSLKDPPGPTTESHDGNDMW
jgi:hypothetical protein